MRRMSFEGFGKGLLPSMEKGASGGRNTFLPQNVVPRGMLGAMAVIA